MKRFLFIIIFVAVSFNAFSQEKIVGGKYLYIGNYVFEHAYGVTYKCSRVYTEKGLEMQKSGLCVPLNEFSIIDDEEGFFLEHFIRANREKLENKFDAKIIMVSYLIGKERRVVFLEIQDRNEYEKSIKMKEEEKNRKEKAKQERLKSLEYSL